MRNPPSISSLFSRVEWFTFLRFSKMEVSLSYNCTGSVPKNRQILPRVRAAQVRQSFKLQKITEALKIIIFCWTFVEIFPLLQRTIATKNAWESNLFIFYFRPPKWAQLFLTWSKFFSSKITPPYCSGTISNLLIFFIFINILNYIPDSGGRPLVPYNNKFINFNQFNINYVGPDGNLNIIQQRGVVAPW